MKILHNPRCSKSRATLKLLEERGLKPEIIDYQKQPPSAAQLGVIAGQLGMEPRQMMRSGEAVYAELKLDDPRLGDEQLLQAMADNPILIQRPIVLANDKAAIGRPPEAVLDIL
ncbi:MAG: arsenate reductase (glutaredoxin) [Rhodanobacteraceae bacterium]